MALNNGVMLNGRQVYFHIRVGAVGRKMGGEQDEGVFRWGKGN